MGRAEDLFTKIKTTGIKAIDEFISERQREELFLDFKRSSDNGSGHSLSNDDRKNLAKAITGFGNSAGGILIWGVECSKKSDEGDLASAKIPLVNAKKFASIIESAVSGLSLPPHAKVENFVLDSKSSKAGFVITYVPQNQGLPLQDTISKHFYIRAGSNFLPAPYQVLASMFGKRPQPNVFNMYTMGPATITPDDSIKTQVGFMLHNAGPGLAKDIFLNIKIWSSPGTNSQIALDTTDRENWSGSFNFSRFMFLISKDNLKLAPEAEVQPLVIYATFKPPFTDGFQLKIACGCDGGPTYKAEVNLTKEEVQNIYAKYIAMKDIWTDEVGHEVTKELFKTSKSQQVD